MNLLQVNRAAQIVDARGYLTQEGHNLVDQLNAIIVGLGSLAEIDSPLPVADGGTGASSATSALFNLGVTSGTYTPTLFNTTNVAASTAYVCQHLRVGDIVLVSGKVDIDVTAATTATTLGMSLPVASNLGAQENLGGTAVMASAGGGVSAYGIIGDAANDRALITGLSGAGIVNLAYGFSFMYRVI